MPSRVSSVLFFRGHRVLDDEYEYHTPFRIPEREKKTIVPGESVVGGKVERTQQLGGARREECVAQFLWAMERREW